MTQKVYYFPCGIFFFLVVYNIILIGQINYFFFYFIIIIINGIHDKIKPKEIRKHKPTIIITLINVMLL